jgi:hypothetical protein
VHSSVVLVSVKPWPLQAFLPLQAFFAPLQALCPLHALAPLHCMADAEAAMKVVAAKTAAAVARTVFLFMFVLPCSSRRWHPANPKTIAGEGRLHNECRPARDGFSHENQAGFASIIDLD